MRHASELSVQPVERYRKPKYPSHQDPDPTLEPDAASYPLSGKLVSALAAMATVVSTSCSPPESQSTTTANSKPNSNDSSSGPNHEQSRATTNDQETARRLRLLIEKDAKEAGVAVSPVNFQNLLYAYEKEQKNESGSMLEQVSADDPFGESPPISQPAKPQESNEETFRRRLVKEAGGNPLCNVVSGLPHQTSPYGTGVPDYVDGDLARRVIEKVFSGAGYVLQENVQYDKDGVAFKLDGYDANKKVGFVVGDWGNLDNDALIRWHLQRTEGDIVTQIGNLERSLAQSTNEDEKQFLRDIQAARQQADSAKRNAGFQSILDRYGKSLLSLKEIEQLETRALEGSEFIAVISKFDQRFTTQWRVRIDQAEIEQAVKDAAGSPDVHETYRKLRAKKIAQMQMAELEKAAREYIEWAKTQGLQ